MAASNEWNEWHLTEDGWVKGTEKTDFAMNVVVAPENRLATFKYQEHVSSVYSKMQISWDMTWKKPSIDITPVVKAHGQYPTSFVEDRVNGKSIKF